LQIGQGANIDRSWSVCYRIATGQHSVDLLGRIFIGAVPGSFEAVNSLEHAPAKDQAHPRNPICPCDLDARGDFPVETHVDYTPRPADLVID
jgi:hypothetical protein